MEPRVDDLAIYAPASKSRATPPPTPKVPGVNSSMPAEQPMRRIKVEAQGDRSWKRIKPKIRLMGNWLQRAGFPPGTHVVVRPISSGIVELRAESTPTSNKNMPLP